MARPVVGITTYLTRASWGYWNVDAALIPASYVRAVERAGGLPVLVPPLEQDAGDVLDAVDGLVFSGGSDLDPELYGAEPHAETTGVHPERDRFELELLGSALERDLPVLAICRGSQVLNVALGGDIVQHLPEVVGHEEHKEVAGVFSEHDVDLVPGSRLGAILGDRAPVKSHHHQGYGRLGRGLHEAARAHDGTIEALEDPTKRFTLGVLWHPEEGEDMALFENLVAAAADYRTARRG